MKENVLSTKVERKINIINLVANVFFINMLLVPIFFKQYEGYRKAKIYDALFMSFVNTTEIEYGTPNYDTKDLIEEINYGELTNYTKEIDTSIVGVQEVKYEIAMEDVSKEFSLEVEVKDTKNPVIDFKRQTVSIYEGSNYDVKSNIESVSDEIDGELMYKASNTETEDTGYYTISTNFNKNKVGTYKVLVEAIDKNGNSTKADYNIKVAKKPEPKVVQVKSSYNGPATVDTSSVVAAARSLVGSRYRFNGNSPQTGFDCSGFIQYIYSLFGKNLSRSSSGIASNGHAVSRENMQPGDIIVWSTRANHSPTHVSLYVGGDTMIHAANTRDGVIVSSVSHWESRGGGHIVTIRRV